LPASMSCNKCQSATPTQAAIKMLSGTPSQLRPRFRTAVRAVLLVTLGIGLLQ